jgi:uncharacterized membrane protein YhhN
LRAANDSASLRVMFERMGIDRSAWLIASLLAGLSFWLVKDAALALQLKMTWKGAGVALLAAYALTRGAGHDARQIALVMVLGALGDVLIEWRLEAGALAFLAGHLVAIQLYWRHRRAALSPSQKLAALAMLVLIPAISFLLPADRSAAPGVTFYALGLGAMCAAAWTSSFSRYRVGLGAVLFAVSDLLIFARLGPMAGSALPGLLIWPLYYFGQVLICVGVIGEIGRCDQVSA